MSWNVVGNISNVQALTAAAGALVGGVATSAAQKYAPNTNTLLESCRQDLEEVKSRLNEIPPERREKIRTAAEQQQYKSLEQLEEVLIELVPSTKMSTSMSLRDFIRPVFLMNAGSSASVPTIPGACNVIYRGQSYDLTSKP
jgi:hypothetical protein